jgi:hypothetical protein
LCLLAGQIWKWQRETVLASITDRRTSNDRLEHGSTRWGSHAGLPFEGSHTAPPHDASGHTWHHADGLLFRITRDGPAAVVGGGYQSHMPGFWNIMSDDEIRAVLAFIKSTWPEQEREYQAEISRRERDTAR